MHDFFFFFFNTLGWNIWIHQKYSGRNLLIYVWSFLETQFIYLPTLNYCDVTFIYTNTQIPLLLLTINAKILIYNIYVLKYYIITDISMKMFMFIKSRIEITPFTTHISYDIWITPLHLWIKINSPDGKLSWVIFNKSIIASFIHNNYWIIVI